MEFSITCPCGAQLRMTSADAGGLKPCSCGTSNSVPSLSELRLQAGQRRYAYSIAEKLRYMHANSELPLHDTCVFCGLPTEDVAHCSVECERPHTNGRGFWGTVLLGMFLPFWLFASINREYMNPEVVGRELTVNTPVPVCPDCSKGHRKELRNLAELLRRVPLYKQLLEEYPKAHVFEVAPS